MTEVFKFKMDAPQPHVLDATGQGVIGAPMDRPDGPAKVTGTAAYSADHAPDGMAHGVLLRATIVHGKVTAIDDSAAKDLPGYLGLFHGKTFLANPAQGMSGKAPEQPDDAVLFHGQPIGLVVAETFETARDAAQRIIVTYAQSNEAQVDPKTARVEVNDDDNFTAGDLDAAMAQAAHSVDQRFDTAGQVSAAMEPHVGMAEWKDGRVTLYGALQMLRYNKAELADALGVDPSKVRILAPYVGGGFGSKLGISAEHVAAAIASRDLGRPVRVVMTRQTVFDAVLRRSETSQRLRFSADAKGTLTGIGHEDRVSNLESESFSEPVNAATRFLYAAPNRLMQQEISRNHRTPSGSVRAPGEAVGMFALETAMDELAESLGICPIELRLRNIPTQHPETEKTFTANALAESLKVGAERFGWADRATPGSRIEGEWAIGMGVASAARENLLVRSAAQVTLHRTGAIVETDMTDIGTGSYAILSQIAAETLGLTMAQVEVRLADSDLPGASGSGGSFGAASAGSAVFLAAQEVRRALAQRLGCGMDDLELSGGQANWNGNSVPLTDAIADPIVREAEISKGKTAKTHFSAGYGAHFAEVAVNVVTGEIRVRRMLGVFGIGRVLNEKTARSQAIGGMIWGVGAALHEELAHDPRTGHIVNRDLAGYHVPAHADIPRAMDVIFLDERDDHHNPIQAKGIGELGISGAGAAIINAVYNATGLRLRSFPATPDKVIAALDARG